MSTPRNGQRSATRWVIAVGAWLMAGTFAASAQSAPATDAAGTMPMTGMSGMAGMSMGPMQGGSAPRDARSPDYSDGVGYVPMTGMDMADDALLGMLLVDRLEAFHDQRANGQAWEAEGWYGGDFDKLWIRSEGERSRGRLAEGDLEALWNHAVAAYWGTQLGVRHDLARGPERDWAAFGISGLAPYWFEVEATAYAGTGGRTAARLRVQYEMLFTQRLVLQPEFETNVYGRADPARRLGSGLSDASFGLRLRYEIRRDFAPYVGVAWRRTFGGTADLRRAAGDSMMDRRIVAGLRFWF